jgi:hypothetical protein
LGAGTSTTFRSACAVRERGLTARNLLSQAREALDAAVAKIAALEGGLDHLEEKPRASRLRLCLPVTDQRTVFSTSQLMLYYRHSNAEDKRLIRSLRQQLEQAWYTAATQDRHDC